MDRSESEIALGAFLPDADPRGGAIGGLLFVVATYAVAALFVVVVRACA